MASLELKQTPFVEQMSVAKQLSAARQIHTVLRTHLQISPCRDSQNPLSCRIRDKCKLVLAEEALQILEGSARVDGAVFCWIWRRC